MVSVIIPTLNAAIYIEKLLTVINEQTVRPDEIIVVDSSSSDGTGRIAASLGARVLTVNMADFDHGGTRNLAIRNSSGEIVVFFTQDALPADRQAVEKLIAPLLDDDNVGCSYGRQLPLPGASVFAAHSRFFIYGEKSYVTLRENGKPGIKGPFLSNSFAAYRRKAMDEIGLFKEGLISTEDTYAGARMLMAGYKIAYAADAIVCHSHNYTLLEEFQRYVDIGVFHRREKWIMDTFGGAGGEGSKFVLSELICLTREGKYGLLPEFFARNCLKYIGFALGRQYDKLPLQIIKRMSKNKNYWTRDRS